MRWHGLALAAASFVAFAGACAAFSAGDEPSPGIVDAGPEGDVAPPPADAPISDAMPEAGPTSFDLAFRPPCPRPPAPSGTCASTATQCVKDRIYRPSALEHPFGIAIDATHVFWLAQPAGTNAGYNGDAQATLRRLDRATHEVVELSRAQDGAVALFANGPYVYWAVYSGQTADIVRLRKDAPACTTSGCPSPETVAPKVDRISYIGAVAPDALFLMHGNGAIDYVSLKSTPPSVLGIGMTSDFPGFALGADGVLASGYFVSDVARFTGAGAAAQAIGTIAAPDDAGAYVGANFLATTCSDVFALDHAREVQRIAATAGRGTFSMFAALPPDTLVYAAAADARFVYFGAANAGGLFRIDTSAATPGVAVLAPGSMWGLAVADGVLAYGEHGASDSDSSADVGAIFLVHE